MSVYGGFATRQLETLYNQITRKMIILLSDRLVKYFNNGKIRL